MYCNFFSTDIAVGAPYDGFGKVYIYHGSKNGINTEPAQVIVTFTVYNYSCTKLRGWWSCLSFAFLLL